MPVEVKAVVGAGKSDARDLDTFLGRYEGAARGLLLSCDEEIRIVEPGIVGAPWCAVV